MKHWSAWVLLASSMLLSACALVGDNCWECGTSITFHNATDRVVEVVWSDDRSASPAKRLEPDEKRSYSDGIPRTGDLRKHLLTMRAKNLSGTVVFCARVSWREFLDNPAYRTVEIVPGDVRC